MNEFVNCGDSYTFSTRITQRRQKASDCDEMHFHFNPYHHDHAKLIYFNFHPLEVVSRYRDPQLQVAENYSYLFNLRTNVFKSGCLNTNFNPNIIYLLCL